MAKPTDINNQIAFRLQGDEISDFAECIKVLGCDRAEFARRAFRKGFGAAFKEISEEQKVEVKNRLKELERAKGFEPSTFTLAR